MKKKDFVLQANELDELISELIKLRDKYIEIALQNEIDLEKDGDYQTLKTDEGLFIKEYNNTPLRFMQYFTVGGDENE